MKLWPLSAFKVRETLAIVQNGVSETFILWAAFHITNTLTNKHLCYDNY